MSKRLTSAVQAAVRAAERVAHAPGYQPELASTLAALERRGATIERLATQDRDGYLYVVTAKKWSKLLRALARVAIGEERAYTSVGDHGVPPYYRQELVFERLGRKFFFGTPIDDVRAELVDEINEWEADYAGAPRMRFLKLIGADAGIRKWPAKIREHIAGARHQFEVSVHGEEEERQYARIAHELREQVENAAPFQVWEYARQRSTEIYEPISKAAHTWIAMTPPRPESTKPRS